MYYSGWILLVLGILAILIMLITVVMSRANDEPDDTTMDEIKKDEDYEAWLKRQGII